MTQESIQLQTSQGQHLAAFLAERILAFPCFSEAAQVDLPAQDFIELVSDAYEDDNLTQEQDLAFESVLYLVKMSEEFDLQQAVRVWADGDYQAFCQMMDLVRTLNRD